MVELNRVHACDLCGAVFTAHLSKSGWTPVPHELIKLCVSLPPRPGEDDTFRTDISLEVCPDHFLEVVEKAEQRRARRHPRPQTTG